MDKTLTDITANAAILDAKTELEVALRYGLEVGKPTHVIDREHVEKAVAILRLLYAAQR